MILAIMQPYFFPYLGYFDLINYSDRWIVFDSVQYIRRGWINRNRILHPKKGWQYFIVPLKKHSSKILIKDVMVTDTQPWKQKIMAQVHHYRKKAPFFETTTKLLEDCLSINESYLSRLNVQILEKVCAYIGITFHYEYFSEMNLPIGPVDGPSDWALNISEVLNAQEYVNLPGGKLLYDPTPFFRADIKLTFRNIPPLIYSCKPYVFEPRLSIIDVLMWNSKENVKDYLDAHLSMI